MLSNFLQRKSYTRRSIYFTKLDDQLSSISRHENDPQWTIEDTKNKRKRKRSDKPLGGAKKQKTS